MISYRTAGKTLYTIAPVFALPFCNTLCYAKSTSYLEDDSERADDVAKKNRSDIYKGFVPKVRRRSNRYNLRHLKQIFCLEGVFRV